MPARMSADRIRQRRRFIAQHGWQQAELQALAQDASFRRYFRLSLNRQRRILMDAPPEHENTARFLKVTACLEQAGMRVPQVFAQDCANGYLLLEDLGDATFTRLLDAGGNEQQLYRHALEALLTLQDNSRRMHLDLPQYDFSVLIQEALLLVDWYLPARQRQRATQSVREDFIDLWRHLYTQLPALPPVLVHRDFHVDNLLMCQHRCALLDYQDALTGSPAYDVVALLQDARRDVDAATQQQIMTHFLRHYADLDTDWVKQHCAFWSAQRHCKVAGIFTRLWLRDGKAAYLAHLPRVLNLLADSVRQPSMARLKAWLERNLSGIAHVAFQPDRESLNRLMDAASDRPHSRPPRRRSD